ncbi:MAG TPA: FumA C-terminus/TtdB family hydratase beta subunit [Candidatus Fimenecus sp.]|nr:FumA C-terminus/TtdB family hydratase beta subunit [Candidatus Fimenecus sp.]
MNTKNIKAAAQTLNAGDTVYLSGIVYTSRDAAHKRIFELINKGAALPYNINGAVQYFAGPTPTPKGLAIGSCGPTTSSRMDVFSPKLLDMGLGAMIGKGPRSDEVCKAIVRNGSVYFCAVGGAGALASKCINSCEVIAFSELGCESVKKLEFCEFPLTVAIDCHGGNLFKQ